MPSLDKSLCMAAMMTQIEHGDWTTIEQGRLFDDVTRDAILLFCPSKLTHLALDHDLSLLQRKLVEHWKTFCGVSRPECARRYISIAQEWGHYGSTGFQVEVSEHCVCVCNVGILMYRNKGSHTSCVCIDSLYMLSTKLLFLFYLREGKKKKKKKKKKRAMNKITR